MSEARMARRFSSAVEVMTVTLLTAMPVAGCGRTNAGMAPASGVVTLAGRPVNGAQVTFMSPAAARAAYGVTDESGRFVLTTFAPGDGAMPGTHVVTITKPGAGAAAPPMSVEKADAAYGAAMAEAARNWAARGDLPGRYADAGRSGLTAEVTRTGPNEFVFALEP